MRILITVSDKANEERDDEKNIFLDREYMRYMCVRTVIDEANEERDDEKTNSWTVSTCGICVYVL